MQRLPEVSPSSTLPSASTISGTTPKNGCVAEPGFSLVAPGSGYGEYGEGYVRMALTVSGDKNGERLEEAVDRLAGAL